MLYALQRAVAALGHCDPPVRSGHHHAPGIDGTTAAWAGWVERWHDTSTLTPRVRATVRTIMAKAGRWLAAEHPEITEPGQWTRQTCAAWVAAVDRMNVGDYVAAPRPPPRPRRNTDLPAHQGPQPDGDPHLLPRLPGVGVDRPPLRPGPRARGAPQRGRADRHQPPRHRRRGLGETAMGRAEPRPGPSARQLRRHLLPDGADPGDHADLAVQRPAQRRVVPAAGRAACAGNTTVSPLLADSPDVLAEDAVCLLDVPVHKTGTAFTKPVDPLLGQAIEAWQALRPAQPTTLDRKTSEHVDMLFAVRAHPVAKNYINRTIIPALCAKAGVPSSDVRGKITSHRARSTIATQLYNAKEPMTLFELQAWLGHRTPTTTQHYAKISPNTLSKAYTEAGYFARNVRTIEVLLDRDAVTSGAAAAGQPWQHYDLGHGWCSYSFFEQCPAPDGLRPLRLLHPERLHQSPAARGQRQPAAHARQHPAHRRRTRRRRRRTHRSHRPARPAHRRPHTRRAHPA